MTSVDAALQQDVGRGGHGTSGEEAPLLKLAGPRLGAKLLLDLKTLPGVIPLFPLCMQESGHRL